MAKTKTKAPRKQPRKRKPITLHVGAGRPLATGTRAELAPGKLYVVKQKGQEMWVAKEENGEKPFYLTPIYALAWKMDATSANQIIAATTTEGEIPVETMEGVLV